MQAHGVGTAARSNNFDALRLLAALLVIWSHQFAVMGLPVPQLLHNEPGALGVVIFFAISGYLVTPTWGVLLPGARCGSGQASRRLCCSVPWCSGPW